MPNDNQILQMKILPSSFREVLALVNVQFDLKVDTF